jgi:putative N6-adenine-specific DNA methylase
MSNFSMVAKTMFGLEQILEQELQSIGAEKTSVQNRAVTFEGSKETLYKANYLCRTALRILVPIAKFKVTDQHTLYKEVSKISWGDYIENNDTIAVDSVATQSAFNNSMFVSLKVKDAIADQFRTRTGARPSVDLDHPSLRINVHIFKEDCTISLDSSGMSLHKRGYRTEANKAPLNEVLAAGLILLTDWDPSKAFIDPMTGSGTLSIEAALMAMNYPAGYFRQEFGFEKWKDVDFDLWDHIQEEAKKEITELETLIVAGDNATKSVKIAKENFKSAGVRDKIQISEIAFQDMPKPAESGVIILNPPYGERMDRDENINELYKEIGDTLKKNWGGYEAWILTSNQEAFKHIGLRPSRKIPVFNGPLECRFLKYELYAGSKKGKYMNEAS